MNRLKLEGFTIIAVPQSPQFPMQIVIDGGNPLMVDLPNTGAFHHYTTDDSEHHSVMFKMDNRTENHPEVSFVLTNSELVHLQMISLLPVID